ncbi:hypothetical protein QTI24_29895 [Variovorax sp. J22P240]|uniref:tetratricopeptide repeat-containing protein n=1 Tax=Variovorax sp. J22P240 TaxID=3053514 RepID=UPI002577E903|nr:tetratricopeptide repeat-containing protein [Variovorax sp. J22P240]MDM0002835.1 hypothetical protein [Variovorax sp. J22P240]
MPTMPICFVVMPFGIKEVPASAANAPGRVDFDRLWSGAISPALLSLGYEPVRADQDIGALIIHEMLERLFFADLVVADMSIPNGNVYYEIGVRHAAKPDGCVLIAADWSTPLFDVQQMRRLTYPLPQQQLSDEQAAEIAKQLEAGIPAMRDGASPMYQVLPGYPNPSADRALTMRKELAEYTTFNERIGAVGTLGNREGARQAALAMAAEHPAATQRLGSFAIPMVTLLRDHASWAEALAYMEALPQKLRELAVMREQRALAQSKSGDHLAAIAGLNAMIEMGGDTSERRGLIGGRHKRMVNEAKVRNDGRAQLRSLNLAIESYEKGMLLELGNYYCVSNLARLYRMRGEEGDEEQAKFVQQLTVVMTESAIASGRADEWARATLLGAAFDAGSYEAAAKAVKLVKREGHAAWKIEVTLADLETSVAQMSDGSIQAKFKDLLQSLRDTLVG